MEIQHRPGKKHTNADALSRIPGGEPCSDFNLKVKLQDLPCGGCPYCTRAHLNWSGFDQDVDDVVPLANKPWVQESPINNSPSVGSSPVSLHLTTQANSGSTRCCSFISSSPGP
jgi:hypothetical protein